MAFARHTLIASLIFLSFFIASIASAGIYDPAQKWRMLRTKHFKLNYPANIEEVAQRAARIFEEVHAVLSPELTWKPWPPTEVVLVDNTDDANGFATVLPYNTIILYLVPPRSDSTLANYDDWLRVLITHEYTHILHLDATGGAWWPLRVVFGKIVSPAGILPVWVREGFATYEETKHSAGGRGRAAVTDMLLRTAVLEGKFLGIDRADGFSWAWPSFNAAYLYGVAFIQYLVDTYGEEKFLEFNKRTQRSLLLTMVNHQAKRIYGKSFYKLWREWHEALKVKYAAEKEQLGELTPLTDIRTEKKHEQYHVPVISPDGTKLVYTVHSPHHHSQLRLLDLATNAETTLRNNQGAVQIAWFPDSSAIVYATPSQHKRYYRYLDLWKYDLATKKTERLTVGQRARDPAISPKEKKVLFVSGSVDLDEIALYDFDTKKITTLLPRDVYKTQFSRPAWSPDGAQFAVSMHSHDDGWKLYLFTAEGKLVRRLTSGMGKETDPVWSPDGRFIFYASDESGISNISRLELKTGKVERVSNVTTGLFHPTTHDGETIIAQHYHAGGYDLKSFHISRSGWSRGGEWVGGPVLSLPKDRGRASPSRSSSQRVDQPERRDVKMSSVESSPFKSEKYVAFGKSLFLPRFVAPNVFFTGDTTIVSAATGASDPLRWHSWQAGVNYRLDAKHMGYFGQYAYSRYRPLFGVGGNDYVVNFGNLTFDTDGDLTTTADRQTVKYFEERRGAFAYVALPVGRHGFSSSYFYEDHFPKTAANLAQNSTLNLGIFSGLRVAYAYADPEFFRASISPEDGRRIRLFGSMTDSALGSGDRNEQIIFSGDWREYLHLWAHHVLGFRAAGGTTVGDQLVQGTFSLGGALGEGALAGGSSAFYFPLRGLPTSTLARTRAMLLSSEYRIPLAAPQRGLGTNPIFLKNIHGALFADYGNAFNAHEGGSDSFSTFFDDFMLGVGTELRGDFVVGHGLPLQGRVGYAIIVVNRDRVALLSDDVLGTSVKYGTLILQIGTAF